ncbi:helix-hairpin-helix domain-containing protein [Haloarcula sp. 1CSR25-25]|uniref:helix-hairpin-helix domain-containing protein n=1 Tax=Haloarcula sp. 1CSR25-25 TaxID=2862545 RepID=UPI002894C629|nr:helix-hairpin-helix domain-containing protein [Haloarcula sp. 1CSR25-25]MDT3437837.1 hypothetical protein [Haloarcula sp. 1CSR25-25]
MQKKKNAGGVNVEAAGEQSVEYALSNAENSSTQASVGEFQEEIEDDVEKAKSDIDEESWQELVDEARETETTYESEIGSRAEKYNENGMEVVDEGSSQQYDFDEGGGHRKAAQPGERESVRRDKPSAKEGFIETQEPQIETVSVAQELGAENEAVQQVFVEPAEQGESNQLRLEEHHFEDAEAFLSGNEEVSLPEDRALDDSFRDLERDEVTGIDFDNLEPPQSEGVGPDPEESGGGMHEGMERASANQAEAEYYAQRVVEQYNNGESPGKASKHAIENSALREDRPWVGEDQGPATGEDYIYRFVEGGAGVDTLQSPAFQQQLAMRQPENSVTVDNTEYGNVFEAITDGNKVLDDDVEPALVAQSLSADSHDYLGETAVQNLKDAGYEEVTDFADATVDDLTEVDEIGPAKAERLIENEKEAVRELNRVAEQLNDTIESDEFDTGDYKRILEYSAEKGVPPEVAETIFFDSAVRKEIPGPTPVTDLTPGESQRRAQVNRSRNRQYVDTHETSDAPSAFEPTHGNYDYQAPIEVKATVEKVHKPSNPDHGEHQVVRIKDHEGNLSKLTIYKDSLYEWEDDEEFTSGVHDWGETTDPDAAVDPNLVLKEGDQITIKNPQVNEFGGGDDDHYDGNTLATTPDTTIKTDAPPRSGTDGTISWAEPSRGGVQKKQERNGVPDYVENKSRAMRRRDRQYKKRHGQQDQHQEKSVDDRTESTVETRDTDDLYSH